MAPRGGGRAGAGADGGADVRDVGADGGAPFTNTDVGAVADAVSGPVDGGADDHSKADADAAAELGAEPYTHDRAFIKPDARARAATERRAFHTSDRGPQRRAVRAADATPFLNTVAAAVAKSDADAAPDDGPADGRPDRDALSVRSADVRPHLDTVARAVSVPFDGGALALTVASTEPHVQADAQRRAHARAHALGAPDRLAGADGVALPDAGALDVAGALADPLDVPPDALPDERAHVAALAAAVHLALGVALPDRHERADASKGHHRRQIQRDHGVRQRDGDQSPRKVFALRRGARGAGPGLRECTRCARRVDRVHRGAEHVLLARVPAPYEAIG